MSIIVVVEKEGGKEKMRDSLVVGTVVNAAVEHVAGISSEFVK